MYKFILCHEQNAPYKERTESIIDALEEIQQKWKVNFSIIEADTLKPTQTEQIKNDIRNIQPQIRGKIITAKNKTLPLSRGKNLNTKNTPVLILYHNQQPINVYPHMLGTTYFEIEPELQTILRNGPEAHLTAKGLLEEPLQKILADDPSILEKGMQFKEANKDVDSGIADIVLQDSEGRMVIVEIETIATETAVAQVSRLAAGYTSMNKLPAEKVRKIILCQRFDERAAKACRGANVELYKLDVRKVC